MLRRTFFSASVLLSLCAVGCGGGESSVVGADAGPTTDALVTDLGVDNGPPDNGPPDVGADVTADLGPPRCVDAASCAGSADGPVCDPTSGRCVACTPTNDVCPAGRYCVAGMNTCAEGCADDADCGDAAGDGGASSGRCDVSTHQCVACLRDEHCPAGTLCVGNLCVTGCSSARACPGTQSCCDGACVDTLSSTAHCGACGARCSVPNAAAACANGACAVDACTAPFADCDGASANGCEADTSTDVTNCGACGRTCEARDNATVSCSAGRCAYACSPGFADCDADPSNGCEVDTRASNANCGGCGVACNPPNATGACAMGVCGVTACADGFGDCDGNPTNGCEADLRSAVAHCGACGNACAGGSNAVGVCAASRCALVCAAGFADCDGDPSNGCEVATATDAMHCGGCGRACALPNTETRCAASTCVVTGCAAGYGDCDGFAANGCETNTATSAAHCGACMNACPTPAGGAAVCAAGACGVACAAGRGDCDGNAANGCEVDTNTSTAHCGRCGGACPSGANSTATCAGGACGLTCAAGFGNCDGSAANGCEANLATDQANCGACGRRGVEACNGVDDDCDGVVDEGYSATGCISLTCTGTGLVANIPDGCIDDGGASAGGDALQVYCVNGISRFCLSGEACPWRSGQVTADTQTCSRSGLSSNNFMARASCQAWNGRINYYCDAQSRIYFP
ncbi:MAG: hypothetical protein R3A52_06195 [Polyangiales bacterium]